MSFFNRNDDDDSDKIVREAAVKFLTYLLEDNETVVTLYVRGVQKNDIKTYSVPRREKKLEEEEDESENPTRRRRTMKSTKEEQEENTPRQRKTHMKEIEPEREKEKPSGHRRTYLKEHDQIIMNIHDYVTGHRSGVWGTTEKIATMIVDEWLKYDKNSIHIYTPGETLFEIVSPLIKEPSLLDDIEGYRSLFKKSYPGDVIRGIPMFKLVMKPEAWRKNYKQGMIE